MKPIFKVLLILFLNFSSFVISLHTESQSRGQIHLNHLDSRKKASSRTHLSGKEKAKAFFKGILIAMFPSTLDEVCLGGVLSSDDTADTDTTAIETQTETQIKTDIKSDRGTFIKDYENALKDSVKKMSAFLEGFRNKEKADYGNDALAVMQYNNMIKDQNLRSLGRNIISTQSANLLTTSERIAAKKFNLAYLDLQGLYGALDDLVTKNDITPKKNVDINKLLQNAKASYKKVEELKSTVKQIPSYSKTKAFLSKIGSVLEKIKKKFSNAWETLKDVGKCLVVKYLTSQNSITSAVKTAFSNTLGSILAIGSQFVEALGGALLTVVPGLNFIILSWRVIKLISPLLQNFATLIKALTETDDQKRFEKYGLAFGNILLFLLYLFTGFEMKFKFDIAAASFDASFTAPTSEESQEETTLENETK